MSAIDDVWSRMHNSGMTQWVGGGDVRAIGEANFTSISQNIHIEPNMSAWDLGCGIGRTSFPLAMRLNQGRVIGTDILLSQIRYCQ